MTIILETRTFESVVYVPQSVRRFLNNMTDEERELYKLLSIAEDRAFLYGEDDYGARLSQ